MARKSEKRPEADITLRFAEVEMLIKALEQLDDIDKKTVSYASLQKRLVGIRDFWLNEEKQRKAKATANIFGKRRYGIPKK